MPAGFPSPADDFVEEKINLQRLMIANRSVSTIVRLPEPTSDTLVLTKAATWGVRRVWRAGYRYNRLS